MNCAEKLFAGQILVPTADQPSVLRQIQGSLLVDVQNVDDYLESIAKGGSPILDDFPFAMPPWEQFVLFFTARDVDTDFALCCHCGVDALRYSTLDLSLPEGRSRELLCTLWLSWPEKMAASFGTLALAYDRDGTVVFWHGFHVEEITGVDAKGILTNAAFLLCATASFANCKNVTLSKIPVSRQVRRRAMRKQELVFEHHQLQIGPLQQILQTDGGLSAHGDLQRSLHICRGHFSVYGEPYGKGKLFGKHEGRFWIPQHARGSLRAGLVTKDYAVMAPKPTTAGGSQ